MKKLIILSALTLTCAISARATVIGDTFRIDRVYPDAGTAFSSTTVTAPGSWAPSSGVNLVTIQDGQIMIDNGTSGWSGAAFNGFVFTDLTKVPNFSSFSLVSVTGNVPPIAPALRFDPGSLTVNFTPTGAENAASDSGQVYTFAFTEGPGQTVPDGASTLALLGMAVAGLAALRRRLG